MEAAYAEMGSTALGGMLGMEAAYAEMGSTALGGMLGQCLHHLAKLCACHFLHVHSVGFCTQIWGCLFVFCFLFFFIIILFYLFYLFYLFCLFWFLVFVVLSPFRSPFLTRTLSQSFTLYSHSHSLHTLSLSPLNPLNPLNLSTSQPLNLSHTHHTPLPHLLLTTHLLITHSPPAHLAKRKWHFLLIIHHLSLIHYELNCLSSTYSSPTLSPALLNKTKPNKANQQPNKNQKKYIIVLKY